MTLGKVVDKIVEKAKELMEIAAKKALDANDVEFALVALQSSNYLNN